MKIQYISDIHLEFYDKQNTGALNPELFVEPVAPYLALVGDIGIPDLRGYAVFLQWCSQRWKKVFVVAGNHEFYNVRCAIQSDMESKKSKIRTICDSLSNVHFLDCSSVFLQDENVRILGCTLWSAIPEEMMEKALIGMNDTRQIYVSEEQRLTPKIVDELHWSHKKWLLEEIETCEKQNEKCLVLSHHLPSFQLIHEKYRGLPLSCCFASDCEDLFRPPVVGWISGHTHTGMKLLLRGIPAVVNPFGYPQEIVETRDRMAVLNLSE